MASRKLKHDKSTVREDNFCKYYAQGNETFNNGTLSYALAFGFDFDKLKRIKDYRKDEEIMSQYNTCRANASRLLAKDNVSKKIIKYLNEILNDEAVDAELARVIKQNDDLNPKISAIREYNKLKSRITEKLDLTTQGKPITSILASVKTDK